jgi:hypothetical protein
MTDVPPPPDPRDEPYYDPRRRDDRDDGGGHGWQLVAVGLIALIIGVGATYLIKDDGGDTETQVRTVQRESQTVTVQAAPSDAVTVTQPPAETVTKTTTLTVTVPTVPETATEP